METIKAKNVILCLICSAIAMAILPEKGMMSVIIALITYNMFNEAD